MTTSTVSVFERTLQTTNDWLHELDKILGRGDTQQAYRVLRAVLMALRDRISPTEAADLGAQLPLLVRGVYYEGWNPSKSAKGGTNKDEFLNDVAEYLVDAVDGNPEHATRAVFQLLANHISTGEIEDIKSNLPADIKALWS